MTSSSIRLGSLWGIPIGVNYSWFVVFFLVTLSLRSLFESEYPHWSTALHWGTAFLTAVLFFASVLVHELSHSLVAKRRGLPVRGITLFIFGGVSQIGQEANSPGGELLIALAGPLTSIVLGVLFLLLRLAFPEGSPLIAASAALASVNLVLGLFNLVPGFPLDGGRVLRAAVWGLTGSFQRATRLATLLGQGIAFLMIGGGVVYAFTVSLPQGLWIALIGWFLEMAASASARQLRLREALAGYTARDLMSRGCPVVVSSLTLRRLVEEEILPQGQRCFVVLDDGRVQGIITLGRVKDFPRHAWESTLVREAMVPVESLKAVTPGEAAFRVLELMDESDINQVPVIEEAQVLGLVSRDSVLHFIRLRAELGETSV